MPGRSCLEIGFSCSKMAILGKGTTCCEGDFSDSDLVFVKSKSTIMTTNIENIDKAMLSTYVGKGSTCKGDFLEVLADNQKTRWERFS